MTLIPHKNKTVRAPSLLESGKRKGIFALRITGPFAKQRRLIAWVLMAIFFVAPWVEFEGRYFLRFDIANDTFWVFFKVWHQTDAFYFLTVPLLLVLTLFMATTVKGRIWCGYACPQTVFLDWLIRPIEEFFEGNAYKRAASAQKKRHSYQQKFRKLAKHIVFFLCGALVANTFLMYFYGPQTIISWMFRSPAEHFGPFLLMLSISALFYFDFAWFREQFCSFVCPYAKFQAVLLDETSPVVHYKPERGEPRGKNAKKSGDCIDCGLCVRVCPTGIDIRDGLQLECIQCMRCVDACNKVMGSLKRPSRLIEFAPAKPSKKKIQPRVVVYGIGYLIILGIFSYGLYSRSDVEVTSIRQARSSSTIYEDGRGANFFQLRLTNTTGKSVDIRIESLSPGVQLICGLCAKKLAPYESRRASLVVVYQKEYDDAHAKGLIVFKGGNKKLNLPLIKSKRGQK